jgi:hypothetical protein
MGRSLQVPRPRQRLKRLPVRVRVDGLRCVRRISLNARELLFGPVGS